MIKALVVDDDEDLLEMVTLMLQSGNINVNSIADSNLLFGKLASDRPDILIMDIFLGEKDGRILCKEIKSRKEFASIPVLLYSAGHILPESIAESRADDFMKKPFEMSTLLQAVRTLSKSTPL